MDSLLHDLRYSLDLQRGCAFLTFIPDQRETQASGQTMRGDVLGRLVL